MARAAQFTLPASVEALKKCVRAAKDAPPKEWRIAGHPGLVLMTRPTGTAAWFLIYRPKHGGKQRKLRLGAYASLSLVVAARMALETRVKIEGGADPAVERAVQRDALTFKALADKFLTESPTLSATTRGAYRYMLESDVYPYIGAKPATLVTADDVSGICRRIKARGSTTQAQRTKTTIGGTFAWALREGYVGANPAKLVPNQTTHKSVRKRTPSLDEVATLWRAVDAAPRLNSATKAIIKLTILTGQRRKEVAGARVSELHGLDTDTPVWIIDGDQIKADKIISEGRMKNGTEQRVYLSRQAAAVFREAVKSLAVGDILFPPREASKRAPHMSGDTITKAVARFVGDLDITTHDMRRALGAFLKDNDYGRDVRDLILHHKDGSVDGVHYSAGARMERQCREAWQAWADHVEAAVK